MAKKLSALDEQGNPVDWWFAYKVPKMDLTDHGNAATGYEYLYYDPNQDRVAMSPYLLTSGKGALDLTLQSTFDSPADSVGWILYNDEMPEEANRHDSGSYGHTKGVIAFDVATKTAFWLLHSWPKYVVPRAPKMPVPNYGQTFLCLSLDLDTAGRIAAQMDDHQEPQVYLPRVPGDLDRQHPLYRITKDVDPNAQGDSNVIECQTRGGLDFKVIAKNRKWAKDFWIDLVGPTLRADMDVETWIRGKIPPMRDSDGVHKVHDVKYIDFHPLGAPYRWPETRDHAKWGHTKTDDWVCVGDINRMVSQEKRGGGTIALRDKKLWNALQQVDQVVVPPGCTDEDTRECIRKTHSA